MKKLLYIIILIFAINTNAKSQELQYTKLENKLLDTIANLKEVRERAAYVKKQTNGKRKLFYMITQKPSKTSPYYCISVMEDTGGSSYPHFSFYINPKTKVIKYQEPVDGKLIDLKTWRSGKS